MQPGKKLPWWKRQSKTARRLQYLERRSQLLEEHIRKLYENDRYLEAAVESLDKQDQSKLH